MHTSVVISQKRLFFNFSVFKKKEYSRGAPVLVRTKRFRFEFF